MAAYSHIGTCCLPARLNRGKAGGLFPNCPMFFLQEPLSLVFFGVVCVCLSACGPNAEIQRMEQELARKEKIALEISQQLSAKENALNETLAKLGWFETAFSQTSDGYLEILKGNERLTQKYQETTTRLATAMQDIDILTERISQPAYTSSSGNDGDLLVKIAEQEALIAMLQSRVDAVSPAMSGFPKFPWPPPKPSSSLTFPARDLFRSANTLGDFDARLCQLLDRASYHSKGYYAVPNGFALATNIEQFNSDGSPRPENVRWLVDSKPSVFSLESYFLALFTSPVGRYRVIVFIISDVPFTKEGTVSREQALGWQDGGLTSLPVDMMSLPMSNNFKCTCLVYEFHKTGSNSDAVLKIPGLDATTHLSKSGVIRTSSSGER